MKVIKCDGYGAPEVLRVEETSKPVPKENELLIKIIAAAVNTGDCEIRAFKFLPWMWLPLRLMLGILKPRKTLGMYFSGIVEAIPVTGSKFKIGDKVFGSSGLGLGAYAEYMTIRESNSWLVKKSEKMSFVEAAALTMGIDSMHFIRMANLQSGEKILINGAGGSIGTIAIQLAKIAGAEVTCTDSTEKLEMLSDVGADHVIDYKKEDFTKNGQHYDVIFDVIGKSPYRASLQSLTVNGRYLIAANTSLSKIMRSKWTSLTTSKKVITQFADLNTKDLTTLNELIESGDLKTVIDREYALEEIVEAHRYVDSGSKLGNVVVTMTDTRMGEEKNQVEIS